MLSFVTSIGTAHGHLSFYVNELSPHYFLISVVDRKNKTHLIYFEEKTAAWQHVKPVVAVAFWSLQLEAGLASAIYEHRQRSLEAGSVYKAA